MKQPETPAPAPHDKKESGRDGCMVENVARVLAEEPRLEAVAFESKSRKLAMATLGNDPGDRLARAVRACSPFHIRPALLFRCHRNRGGTANRLTRAQRCRVGESER